MRDEATARSGDVSAVSKAASVFCLGSKCPGHCPCGPASDMSDNPPPGFIRGLMASGSACIDEV